LTTYNLALYFITKLNYWHVLVKKNLFLTLIFHCIVSHQTTISTAAASSSALLSTLEPDNYRTQLA